MSWSRSDSIIEMPRGGRSPSGASFARPDRTNSDLNPAQYIPGNTAFDKLSTDQRRVYSGCSPASPSSGCPHIFSDIFMNSNSGNSHDHALQVSLEKRPGPGLPGIFHNTTLLASYTYSKAMQELAQSGGITDVSSGNGMAQEGMRHERRIRAL